MMHIKQFIATVPVQDLDRAADFYEHTLGFKPMNVEDPDGILLDVGSGGCAILLYQTQAAHGSATRVAFDVSSLDDEMKRLREAGVVFEDYDMPDLKTQNGVAEYEGHRTAWFQDSEGNVLAISENAHDRATQPIWA